MTNMIVPSNSVVMFVRTDSSFENMSKIPDIVSGFSDISEGDRIKVGYIKNENNSVLDINNISFFYNKNSIAYPEDFKNSQNKYVFFTIDLDIRELVNIQFILVLFEYFKINNINYYIILNSDGLRDSYFKIYHFFNMQYANVYSNTFVRENSKTVSLPKKELNYNPGEILPFFFVDKEFYKSCLSCFTLNEKLFIDIINSKDIDIKKEIKKYYGDISTTQQCLLRLVYGYLSRTVNKINDRIIKCIKSQPEPPILCVLLFVALLSKSSFNNLNILYENCLDYALSLEQLIENSFFYANNGVLVMRIHQNNSSVMSKYCKKNNDWHYWLEISLIDFQTDKENRSIVSHFIKNAEINEEEKRELEINLNSSDGLKNLFQPSLENKICDYYKKPNVLIQHYGLQTINIFAQKTNSLLCVRSGKNFYTNSKNSSVFLEQHADAHNYVSGVYYKIFIPIHDIGTELVYIGFNSNKNIKFCRNYTYFKDKMQDFIEPTNREDKTNIINYLKQEMIDQYDNNCIFVVNAFNIDNRVHLECVVKAMLGLLYEKGSANDSVCVAMVGVKNKTFVKIAIRFIALCYNRNGSNDIFINNEFFLCNEKCDIEVLISGENYKDIISNLSAQRVFGTIDDDMFDEIKLTLNILDRGE